VSLKENKALARRIMEEGYVKGNLAAVDEILAAGFVDHDPDSSVTGDREGLKKFIKISRDAFSDIQCTIDDVIAEKDKVMLKATFSGTHKGAFMGIRGTGKRVAFKAITIERFAAGKEVERWSLYDRLGLMQQLGAIPSK
jgi:predicted ester cyclase